MIFRDLFGRVIAGGNVVRGEAMREAERAIVQWASKLTPEERAALACGDPPAGEQPPRFPIPNLDSPKENE